MNILKSEIEVIQRKWADAIIAIGFAHEEIEDYQMIALDFIEDLYGFDEIEVLFKPAFVQVNQFRQDKLSALSYYIGGNVNFKEDTGFALKNWKEITFKNHGFVFKDNQGFSMGNYFFTDNKGITLKLEYTMGFFISKDGEIKLNLHHSSVPYTNI